MALTVAFRLSDLRSQTDQSLCQRWWDEQNRRVWNAAHFATETDRDLQHSNRLQRLITDYSVALYEFVEKPF